MDGHRFDRLTLALAAGSSRRQVIKGLLGLGGAAALSAIESDVDARTLRTRPTIPPPPPPVQTTTSTPAPTTTTADPCQSPAYRCGLECCAEGASQCCDQECCANGHTCLTRVFAEGPNVEEEVCCPTEQTCDDQCCNGTCYDPDALNFPSVPDGSLNPDFSCCPGDDVVCAGDAGTHCCTGDTPQCCLRDGVAICIAADACCTDDKCTRGECDVCDTSNPIESTCVDRNEICELAYGPCSQCAAGVCEDTESLCGDEGCLTCANGLCISDDAECPEPCSTCVNGVCEFNCQDGGVEMCCTATGNCGDPVCNPDGSCSYVADQSKCPNACDECVANPANTTAGAFSCQPIPADTLICRQGTHAVCDPPEYCDGQSLFCPDDEWATNFTTCGTCQICMNGECFTVEDGNDPDNLCGNGYSCVSGQCACDDDLCGSELNGLCCNVNGVTTCVANAQCCDGEIIEGLCDPCSNECKQVSCNEYVCNCDNNVGSGINFPCNDVANGFCCNGECTEFGTDTNCGFCGTVCVDPANGVSTCVDVDCVVTCNDGYILNASGQCQDECSFHHGWTFENGTCARRCSAPGDCDQCAASSCIGFGTINGDVRNLCWPGGGSQTACTTDNECALGELCNTNGGTNQCWSTCNPIAPSE